VRTAKSAVKELLRITWRTVGRIVTRVSADAQAKVDRFAGLRRIGIDEISYKRGHRYLTVVVDHDSGHDLGIGHAAIQHSPQEEKRMIFHINRLTFKSDLSEEQRRVGLELLRQAGEANPAVQSYVVGPDLGGEFEWGAVYVLEDLDGYWEYLTHPAHVRSEMNGMELIDRFEAFDITDSDDPELGDKIAKLQARNYEEHPALAELVAQVPSFTVPEAEGKQ
jgi:hypothetical protein